MNTHVRSSISLEICCQQAIIYNAGIIYHAINRYCVNNAIAYLDD